MAGAGDLGERGSTIVRRVGSEKAVVFAARECARYLARMSGRPHTVRAARDYDPDEPGVWVGSASRLGKAIATHGDGVPDGRDAIYASAGGGHAVLAGSNPRSVWPRRMSLRRIRCRRILS